METSLKESVAESDSSAGSSAGGGRNGDEKKTLICDKPVSIIVNKISQNNDSVSCC